MHALTREELVPLLDRLQAALPAEVPQAIKAQKISNLLTGRTRLFQGLSGVKVMLTPLDVFGCKPIPFSSRLEQQIEADRALGYTLEVFVAIVTDADAISQWEELGVAYLLWNATRGLGTVVCYGTHGAPETLLDIWAQDLAECLTV